MTVHDELAAYADAEAHKRQLAFQQRRQAYDGDMPAPLIGVNADLDNTRIPAPTNIVDDGAAFLFGEEPTFDVTETYGEEAQKYLERLWRENRMPTKLLELAKFGGYAGTCGFKFEPDTSHERDGRHEWVVFDPAYLDVVWDPHNVRKVLRYRFEYPTTRLDDRGHIKVFVARQDITAVESAPDRYGRTRVESWSIQNWEAEAPRDYGTGTGRWLGFQASRQLTTWKKIGEHEWPFEWAPVFVWQNLIAPGQWWGRADIDDAILALTNQLNRITSNAAKTVRLHAGPRTVVIGGDIPDDLPYGAPLVFEDATPETLSVANLEMESELVAALELLREVKADLYEAAHRPDVSRGKVDSAGNLSGTAIRLMFRTMLSQNGEKRRTYGDGLEAALVAALAYAKYTPKAGASPDVPLMWTDPLPRNEKEDAEVAEIDQRLGASQRTTLTKRGYNADEEAEARTSEGSVDPGMRGMLDLIDSGDDDREDDREDDSPTSTDASVSDDE